MSYTITKATAEKLMALANHIELHADQFDYDTWCRSEDSKGMPTFANNAGQAAQMLSAGRSCNTTGCIAGWAVHLAEQEGNHFERTPEIGFVQSVSNAAAEFLELGWNEAHAMFFGGIAFDTGLYDPEDIIREHDLPRSVIRFDPGRLNACARPKVTGVEAAKMLRMIASGDVDEWRVVD